MESLSPNFKSFNYSIFASFPLSFLFYTNMLHVIISIYCLRADTPAFPRGLTDEDRTTLRIEVLENK